VARPAAAAAASESATSAEARPRLRHGAGADPAEVADQAQAEAAEQPGRVRVGRAGASLDGPGRGRRPGRVLRHGALELPGEQLTADPAVPVGRMDAAPSSRP
jgi:hypothetical protein